MSYDISLTDPVTHETLQGDHKHLMRGGTYIVDGTYDMWLNVTYNYSRWYNKEGIFPEGKPNEDGYTPKGIRTLDGMSGVDSLPILDKAIDKLMRLKEDLTEEEIKEIESQGATGYWLPTRENALRPLFQLKVFAKLRPDGVWKVD